MVFNGVVWLSWLDGMVNQWLVLSLTLSFSTYFSVGGEWLLNAVVLWEFHPVPLHETSTRCARAAGRADGAHWGGHHVQWRGLHPCPQGTSIPTPVTHLCMVVNVYGCKYGAGECLQLNVFPELLVCQMCVWALSLFSCRGHLVTWSLVLKIDYSRAA